MKIWGWDFCHQGSKAGSFFYGLCILLQSLQKVTQRFSFFSLPKAQSRKVLLLLVLLYRTICYFDKEKPLNLYCSEPLRLILEPQQLRTSASLKNHRRILYFANHKHALCAPDMLERG